jgi:hypothetical protein
MIAGVRIENTSQEYQGNQYDADEDENTLTDKVSDSYINILPGLHLKYDFNKTTILRAAWTNTLARPNYFSLVPYREITREDNEIAIGNPDLIPTTSMNFDLMFENTLKPLVLFLPAFSIKTSKISLLQKPVKITCSKVQPGILTVSLSMEEMQQFLVLRQQHSVNSTFCPDFGKVLDCMPTTPIQPAV